VFACSGKLGRNFTTSGLLARTSRFREFQESGTVPQKARVGMAVRRSSALKAAVMRRFARVVALPGSKNSDLPQPNQQVRTAELQDTVIRVSLTSGYEFV